MVSKLGDHDVGQQAAVGMPLSMTCAGTGAWISVSQSSQTHLPRTWRSTVNTPGV
jgi:hypothetical protein